MKQRFDVIVLGGGPAGLSAGIYLGRGRLKTLIVDTGTIGGQTVFSYSVANYPGVEETAGMAISRIMLNQAKHFGCKVISQAEISSLELGTKEKTVVVEDEGTFLTRAIIVATGGIPRTLGLESENRFKGKGISYCATCDGDFFTNKPIVAIGGGNSALEEALALTQFASKVTVVHEFDHFQAQPWVVSEAEANPKIDFLMEQDILDFEGDEKLERVIVTHKKTGERTVIHADGCFIFIGYVPNTSEFRDLLELTDSGEIIVDEDMRTGVPGVFAAGDVRSKRYRQITTAVADGTIAALSAAEYIQHRE